MRRPQFEHVTVAPGESWALLWRELPGIPFAWHYHPEFELTLTLNARGQRYVGDHQGDFGPGDLVLVAPNQPHTWAAEDRPDPAAPMLAVVVWFSQEWVRDLVRVMPELWPLSALLGRSTGGLAFTRSMSERVSPMMLELGALAPAARLPVLLRILLTLSEDEASVLATVAPQGHKGRGQVRLRRVLDRLHRDPARVPAIPELAACAALSVGAFHRFFRRHTGLTVLEYLARLRVGHACQLLIDGDLPVGLVAAQVGYRSLAHFNRQFRAQKGCTPSVFRQRYRRAEAVVA